MARLRPNIKREIGFKKEYLGRVLLFCEGQTEFNYFKYFADIINSNRNKYSHIEIQLENVKGNARTVLTYAEEFMEEGNNKSKYHNYDKYLIFDCDDPKDIQSVINEMIESENEFMLLLTNLLFETWLLMHFEEVNEKLKKRKIITKLSDLLGLDEYGSKEKSSEGLIRKIIGDGSNVINAITNAKGLDIKYKELSYDIKKNIDDMNPYTTVYKLVEKVLDELK